MRATSPLVVAGLVLTALTSCSEPPTGGAKQVVPVEPMPTLAILRGTVDLDRGTLEFAPILPGSLPGFTPAIYGDQNVNVRLYNSPVVVDSSTSTWTYTASVGIRNLRSHFVGDEEASPVPLDTMGVYVFFVQEPVPGQPCPGCVVTIANFQGTMSFDAPNRKYFHWPERLNPVNSPLGDTTLNRRVWIFATSAGVRSFTFNVLVAAAWPPPDETRWRIEYTADALPGASAPAWKFDGAGGNPSVSGGVLSLRGGFEGMYFRRDPIAPTQSAYVNAVARLNGGSAQPEIGMILSDRVRLIGLGIANNAVGLITNTGTFLPGTTSALGNATHTFELRKYAADSAVFYVDGARRAAVAYAGLSLDTFSPALSSVSFGALPGSGGSTSTWSSVIYEIGVASP